MKRPWLVPEARLPEAFPPAGPVDRVIVKHYPPHRLARVAADGDAGDGAFMHLFGHIRRGRIAMTAPVEMVWEERAQRPRSMAFVYAREQIGRPGPDPADGRVIVEDVAAGSVVSVGQRGGYGRRTLLRGLEKLRAWLVEHPEWVEAGAPRSLAYNSPFVPDVFKYSEVQIPVAPRDRPVAAPPAPTGGPADGPAGQAG